MNNFFNYPRFSLLVKRQWVENRKLFLMATLVIFGMGIITYSLNFNWVSGSLFNIQGRTIIFFIGFFLSGSLSTSYIFKDLSDKNSSTSYLLVPASHFEKLSSGVFYAIIVLPAVYLIVFYFLDTAFVSIANSILDNHKSIGIIEIEGDFHNKRLFENLTEIEFARAGLILPIWFGIQAFIILGSISFMQWSFIKTGFAGFVILFVIVLLVGLMEKLLLDDLSNELGGTHYFQIKPTRDMLNGYVMFGLKYALTPLLLVIAYFRLKEKQV